jgi:hypothetical protein
MTQYHRPHNFGLGSSGEATDPPSFETAPQGTPHSVKLPPGGGGRPAEALQDGHGIDACLVF